MAQDYNKIFASGASSTQEWTDENYLKGWGYLGQTPPPYQLFDALFKRLDLKTQELNSNQNNIANNYLPLAGGTMAGLLSLFAGSTIPTPDAGDNSKKIVNSEWVQSFIQNFVDALSDKLEIEWSGSTFTVPALGITGLMAQNGYICLGKLFGNLILQWGTVSVECINEFSPFYEGTYTGNWNIPFDKFCFGAFSNVDIDVYGPADEISNIKELTKTSYTVAGSTSLQNATMSINFVSFGV